MKKSKYQDQDKVLNIIQRDRVRTNLLKYSEQRLLGFLVQRVPFWIKPDMLTFTGFVGTLIVLSGFILATLVNRTWLLMSVAGFVLNWLGDSLDGRVAVFRNCPRKWYGFALDISIDWITVILIGLGFIIYADGLWKVLGFVCVVFYGWEMITTLLRYRITGKYTIDSGLIGPTEGRIVFSLILITEVIFRGSIIYSAVIISVVLLFINILDFRRVLWAGDDRDQLEKGLGVKTDDDGKVVNY